MQEGRDGDATRLEVRPSGQGGFSGCEVVMMVSQNSRGVYNIRLWIDLRFHNMINPED